MARFAHASIQPKTYLVKGRKVRIGRDDNAAIAANVRNMLKEGLNIPVMPFHPEEGTEYESPTLKQKDALDTVGWVTDARVDRSGRLKLVFDVAKDEYADGIRNKQIRFTSPQLKKDFVDANGKVWGPCVTHLALTPFPRVTGTEDIEEVPADIDSLEEVAFSAFESTTSFSMVADAETDESDPEIEELAEHYRIDDTLIAQLLEKIGVTAPGVKLCDNVSQWAKEFVEALQKKAAQNFVDNSVNVRSPMGTKEENFMSANFSALADHQDENVRALFAAYAEDRKKATEAQISGARTAIAKRIDAASWIPPAARERLQGRLDKINFSATGEAVAEDPSFTADEVLEVMELAIPPEQRMGKVVEPIENEPDQLKKEVIHPDAQQAVIDQARADEIIREELNRFGSHNQ